MKLCLLAVSFMQRLQILCRSIRTKVTELNFFKTPTMRTDPFEYTTLKMATHIYLVLLCLSMVIILLFTWLNVQIKSKIIENPSLIDFEDLHKKYSSSLECPCKQIAIPHHLFISISPQFHPVCTSLFTSNEWLRAVAEAGLFDSWRFQYNDVFSTGYKFFTSLNTFCLLMKTIVSDASFIFNQKSLITDQVLSEAEFTARGQQILTQFKSNIAAESNRTLMLIHSQITTTYTTGKTDVTWHRSHQHNGSCSGDYQTIPTQINNCSCALSDKCKLQLVLYNHTDRSKPKPGSTHAMFDIPHMFSSCFATRLLLQSSLQCFFDQKCVDPFVEKLNILQEKGSEVNSTILQINSTRFSPDMLLEEIISEMMIETWNDNINYSQYYGQCAPKLCTYFITSNTNVLYIFTTTIGLFGGLSVALRIIVPFVVTWIRKKIYRRDETNGMTGKSS